MRSVSCQNFSTRRWISNNRWAGVGGRESGIIRVNERESVNKGARAGSAAQPGRRRRFGFRPYVGFLVPFDDRAFDVLDMGMGPQPDAVGLEVPDTDAGQVGLLGLDAFDLELLPGRGRKNEKGRQQGLPATYLDPVRLDRLHRGSAVDLPRDRAGGQGSVDGEPTLEEHRASAHILSYVERALPL